MHGSSSADESKQHGFKEGAIDFTAGSLGMPTHISYQLMK
jgi:hypothetical protein